MNSLFQIEDDKANLMLGIVCSEFARKRKNRIGKRAITILLQKRTRCDDFEIANFLQGLLDSGTLQHRRYYFLKREKK